VLFSDIVMPGKMNGFSLAREAKRRYPAIKVLLTSGYAGKILQRSDDQGEQFELLSKPYGKRDLAANLKQILES
jgi:CheY-like chemotaxis protein